MLKLCKLSVAMLFINLYVVFTLTGSYIPNGTLIFGMLSVLFMVLDALNSADFGLFGDIRTEAITLVAFLIWAFITAPLALNTSVSINASIDFLQKLLFVFVIFYICRKDGTLRFITILFLLIALISAVIIITMYGVVSERLSLSENISINSTGNLMVLGIFAILYLYQGKQWYSFTVLVGVISLFLFVIALTGSRKSFFAVIILIVFYLVFLPEKSITVTAKSFFSMMILLALLYFLYVRVVPMISETSLYDRLFDEQISAHANESNVGRWRLYQLAWWDFKTSPLFGMGLGGFQVKHGSYSHSAYMEVLSGTGIIGGVLYFTSYVGTLRKLWIKMRDKTQELFALRQSRLIICFFIVFLYIGVGIGHLYDNLSMLELGMFLAAGCSITKSEDTVITSEGVLASNA